MAATAYQNWLEEKLIMRAVLKLYNCEEEHFTFRLMPSDAAAQVSEGFSRRLFETLRRHNRDLPPPNDCPHSHEIETEIRDLCCLSRNRMFTAKCPHESPWALANERFFTNCGDQTFFQRCAVCGISDRVRYPLIWYCPCLASMKVHPECLVETAEANVNFFHHCVGCKAVFIGTKGRNRMSPAALAIRIPLEGRTIFVNHLFHPNDTYEDVISLLRRLRFIAHIPKLQQGDCIINSSQQWWDSPIDTFKNEELHVKVSDRKDFTISVLHNQEFTRIKLDQPYLEHRGAKMWVKGWEEITEETLKRFKEKTNIDCDISESLLTQQTAEIGYFDDEGNQVVRRCILVRNDEDEWFYEDLDSGTRVQGSTDAELLEFFNSGVGNFLPNSSNSGLVLKTRNKMLLYDKDGSVSSMQRHCIHYPHLAFLLIGYSVTDGERTSLYFCLNNHEMTEIYLPQEDRVVPATPDMVRTYVFFYNDLKLPKLRIPCKRKLLLYIRYGCAVKVEDGTLKIIGFSARRRWGSTWLRLKPRENMHIQVSMAVSDCDCRPDLLSSYSPD